MSNGSCIITFPVSMSWSRKKVVTPVRVSPLITAQLMGAAPRYCGKRAACTLKVPYSGMSHTTSGNILNATTTCRLAPYESSSLTNASSFIFTGCSTGSPCSTAYCFTCDGWSTLPCLPTGLSGCVTTATTLYPPLTRASRVATANSGVPINTILRSSFFISLLSRSMESFDVLISAAHHAGVDVAQPIGMGDSGSQSKDNHDDVAHGVAEDGSECKCEKHRHEEHHQLDD